MPGRCRGDPDRLRSAKSTNSQGARPGSAQPRRPDLRGKLATLDSKARPALSRLSPCWSWLTDYVDLTYFLLGPTLTTAVPERTVPAGSNVGRHKPQAPDLDEDGRTAEVVMYTLL